MNGSLLAKFRTLHTAWKGAIIVGILFVLYTIVGFFAVGPIARGYLEKTLTETTHRQTTIERLDFNPLTLAATVTNFRMQEPTGNATFVSMGQLYLNMSTYSLFILGPYVQELSFTEPYVHIALNAPGKYNFSDLIAPDQTNATQTAAPEKKEKKGKLFPWLLENFAIDKGRIEFDNQVVGAHHVLSDLEARVPFSSTLEKYITNYTKPYLAGLLNGTPFRLEGKTLPFETSRHTEFDIKLAALDLRDYWKYLPLAQTMKLDKGTFTSNLELVFERTDKVEPVLYFQGNASVKDFSLSPLQGDPFLKFSALDLDLRKVWPLLRIFQFDAISLDKPYVALHRDANGTLDLVTRFTKPFGIDAGAPAPAPSDAPLEALGPAQTKENKTPEVKLELVMDAVDLRDGTIRFADDSGQGTFKKTISDLNIGVGNFTLAQGSPASFQAALRLGPNERPGNERLPNEHLEIQGHLSPLPFSMNATITASNMDISSYAPYYAAFSPVHVDSGKAGLHSGLFISTGNATRILIENATATVDALHLSDPRGGKKGASVLQLPEFKLSGMDMDVTGRQLHIANILLANATTQIIREKDGSIYPVRLFTRQTEKETTATAPAATPNATKEEAGPFNATVDSVALRDWDLTFRDRAAPGKARIRLAPLTIEVSDISSDLSQTMRVNAAMRINGKGGLKAGADVHPAPLAVQGDLDLSKLALDIINGYIPEDAGLRLSQGDLNITGNYDLRQNSKGKAPGLDIEFKGGLNVEDMQTSHISPDVPLSTLSLLNVRNMRLGLHLPENADNATGDAAQPHIEFNGDVVLSNAKAYTVDGKQLATLDSLNATRIAFAQLPRTLSIGTLTIQGPKADLIRLKDGSMNTSQLFPGKDNATRPAAENATQAVAASPAPLTMGNATVPNVVPAQPKERAFASMLITNATLQGGQLRFTDHSVAPVFALTVDEFTGRMDRFSLEPGSHSIFNMHALVDGQAPFNVEGEANPLERAVHTVLQVTIDNFNLPALSPYTIDSLAYPVATGKLHGRTSMTIQQEVLNAENIFQLDRFSLGDHVASPNAANVPIKLALALLQDSNGDMEIDVPIKGRLDDPDFRLGKMIMRAIIGLFSNIVTSPFNLLGNIVGLAGSGDEISVVEFVPGSNKLSEQDIGNLTELGKAMKKRPRLEMVVNGFIDPDKDAAAIGRQRLTRHLDKLRGGNGTDENGEIVTIEGPDRARLVQRVFSKSALKEQEKVQDPTPEQMEQMLVQTMLPTPEELSELAQTRAKVVRDYLIGQADIDRKRIFLKYTRADVPPRIKGGVRSRVEMSLK